MAFVCESMNIKPKPLDHRSVSLSASKQETFYSVQYRHTNIVLELKTHLSDEQTGVYEKASIRVQTVQKDLKWKDPYRVGFIIVKVKKV